MYGKISSDSFIYAKCKLYLVQKEAKTVNPESQCYPKGDAIKSVAQQFAHLNCELHLISTQYNFVGAEVFHNLNTIVP